MKKKNRELEFLQTLWEYPVGLSYGAAPIEYAYFLDVKNHEVIKLKVVLKNKKYSNDTQQTKISEEEKDIILKFRLSELPPNKGRKGS